jgi:asparagine synthase (glutamine-hydrolysing)
MQPYLPDDVIYRKKTAFGAPLRQWIQHDLRQTVAALLSPEKLRQRGIFSPEAVNRLIEDNINGRVDGSYTIFSILCIEIWCQLFIDGTSYQSIRI